MLIYKHLFFCLISGQSVKTLDFRGFEGASVAHINKVIHRKWWQLQMVIQIKHLDRVYAN
jgi:hypothetical protein